MTNTHCISKIKEAISALGNDGQQGTQKNLADVCGCSQRLVVFWLRGERLITLESCLKIEKATQGSIKAVDIRPDLRSTIEQLKEMAHAQNS